MSSRYVLSIDQGTTGSTVIVLDEEMRVLAKVNQEFPQIFPKPGWVEHDPEAIWSSVTTALARALAEAKIDPGRIAGIGITNQRETTILFERRTGRPVANAIVWQDRRTAPACEELRRAGREPLFRERTGLVLDPYFSGTKLRWLLDHVEGARRRAAAGELAFGTVDTFLVHRLTGSAVHVTEPSNASRTLLFGLERLAWDAELLAELGVPPEILPEVKSSSEVYGQTRGVPGLPDGIPVAGAAGDQQAALFGQACFTPGEAKCTYGTGAFLLVNTGERRVASRSGLLTTVGWTLPYGAPAGVPPGGVNPPGPPGAWRTTYALEGSAFIAGAAVQWLRDGLKLIGSAGEIESLARSVPDSGGVVFVPALVGLGAPHWRPEARGAITGITRGTTAAHLARATLEGIALSIRDLALAAAKDLGAPLSSFKVDGGAAANDLLMQLQTDLLELPIVRPKVVETTGLGAAFLAGLAVGVWKSPEEIRRAWQEDRRFTPAMGKDTRDELLTRWSAALSKL
jgi:glycerol kinase